MQTIRALREARGLTQHQLAALVGTSSAVVSHWETGNRGISAVMLRKVARALGVSMDEIALPGDRENDRSS
jgi:transcriptional regulator with XRE-family HTH domain